MRLFVTGDVHGDYDYNKIERFRKALRGDLTLEDYLVICGDFGILWDGGKEDRYFKEVIYGDFPCTILWVDGNHENFDVLESYPQETWMGGRVHRITDRIFHLCRGEIFALPVNGSTKNVLAFGGAKSTDRGYNTGYNNNWWPRELPNKAEMDNAFKNLAAREFTVDYIFTHDGPIRILRTLLDCIPASLLSPMRLSAEFNFERPSDWMFTAFLEKLACTACFKDWFFGHHHYDFSMDAFHCMYNNIMELGTEITLCF